MEIVIAALIAFVAFREWLRHQNRAMIHKERLVALEKGIELPPLAQEVKRSNWNVQWILLLAGLIWISLGISVFVVLDALIAQQGGQRDILPGMQWIGLAPFM